MRTPEEIVAAIEQAAAAKPPADSTIDDRIVWDDGDVEPDPEPEGEPPQLPPPAPRS